MNNNEQSKLESKFNQIFKQFISQAHNPQIRGMQSELLHFFKLGFQEGNAVEKGKVITATCDVIRRNGKDMALEVSVGRGEPITLDDVVGIVVKQEELEDEDEQGTK